MSKFKESLQTFGKECLAFISSPVVLKNLGIMLSIFTVMLVVTVFSLRSCTRHGESLEVPDFSKIKVTDAIKKAKANNFNIALIDSIDPGSVTPPTPGIVFNQVPAPLSRVKKNRTIYLTVTKMTRDKVILPSTIGVDEYEPYEKKLRRLGLKSEIKERVLNERYDANTILYFLIGDKKITFEDIKKGVEVEKGTLIGFVITERGDNYVSIPNLTCSQFERAEFLIQGYQLVLGNVQTDETVTDKASAFVYKQVPAFDSTQKIRIGQQIELYLTQSRPIDCPSEEELDPFEN